MPSRAGDARTCSALFHHTTAMGHCSRCGGSWKARHQPKAEACGFCHLGTVPATGRGSDGFEPCPYCDGTGLVQ